jgi:hypothetical protein
MKPIHPVWLILLLVQAPAALPQELKPHPSLAQILQTLEAFNHPESSAVSLDSQHLFVTNSAATEAGFPIGQGSISKLEIQPDGTLKMLKADFVKGLTAPHGIAVLPKSTRKFRAGSLFVSTGCAQLVDDKATRIKDTSRLNPGVSVLDPETGQPLGHIPIGPGTAAAGNFGHPGLQPNGLCFDAEANLYVADAGGGGDELEPAVRGRPSIKRFRHPQIDPAAENKVLGELVFIPVRHVPNGVFYSTHDDALYWTTSGGQGDAGGAAYRIPRKEFPHQTMVANVVGGINPLEGLCITPGESLIMSRQQDGDIAYITKRRLAILGFLGYEEAIKFSTPADIKLLTLKNGHNILYIPEQDPESKQQNKQRLRVVLLPTSL